MPVEGLEVTREFVEVETGKGSDALERRPQLRQALAVTKKLKCAVVVAKLDRLSRDVSFIVAARSLKLCCDVGQRPAQTTGSVKQHDILCDSWR